MWLAVVVALLAAVCRYAPTYLFKAAVEKNGKVLSGENVTVGRISVDLIKGRLLVQGLSIQNPEPFTGAFLAEFDEIEFYPELKSLFSDTVIIKKLFINRPRFSYEQSETDSNINILRKHLEALPDDAEASGCKKVVVNRLLITNGQVTGKLTGMLLTVPIRPINQSDLGKAEKGITCGKLAAGITHSILNEVTAAIGDAGGRVLPAVSNNVAK